MTGLSRITMTPLDASAHLAQSIGDILSTPIGTRVLRRNYGSDVPALIDRPMNGDTLVDLYVAVAEALNKWEPRFTLSRIQIEEATAGRFQILLDGETVEGTDTVSVTVGGAA